ncbi:hypothetical protein Hte_007266 [Hypoxylon texense]
MAVPDLRMPSFGFTEDEKVDNDVHILSLLNQCMTFLDNYRENSSTLDLDDASFALEQALVLAEDLDVCQSPPLARCYLYKGHVLCAMEKYYDARTAYRKALRVLNSNPIDNAASEQAAALAVEMEHKARNAKRKGGIWSPDRSMWQDYPPKVRLPIEYCGGRLRRASSRYVFPPCQQVRRSRPFITEPRLQDLPQPQRLVESGGVWTAEVISAPSRGETIRASLRCYVQDSIARGAEDCFTIRAVVA